MMLLPVALFLLAVLAVTRRRKGPVWAMCIAWLFCLSPITLGLISYSYLHDKDYAYSAVLIAYLAAYCLGIYLASERGGRRAARARPSAERIRAEFARVSPIANICWIIAIIGSVLVVADYILLGGAGLSDLAQLRDVYVSKSSASIYAQLGSVMSWACLFCYLYAFFFRKELGPLRFTVFILPIVGYFGLSVLSAGRQASFQIMLFSITIVIVTRMLRRDADQPAIRVRPALITRERVLVGAISAAMIAYMMYVATARNDGAISIDEAKVLEVAFDYKLAEPAAKFIDSLSLGLRGGIVGGMTYFSSPIALFEPFQNIYWPKLYGGVFTFPLILRQLEPLTGVSVLQSILEKTERIDNAGILGVGWATSMQSYVIDFGAYFAFPFVVMLGFASQYAWERLARFESFYFVVLGIIGIINAIYMPLIPAIADNNILLLSLFCIGMHYRFYRIAFVPNFGTPGVVR